MFDKEYMMEDEYGSYLRRMAREVPMTIDRVDRLVSFISEYVDTRNRIIKKYKEDGKDTTSLELDRDYALYVLGLGEKPVKHARVIL